LALSLPEWTDQNGTFIILLGSTENENEVLGDPNRDEGDIKGISSYLNRRLWNIPNGIEIIIEELRHKERDKWPANKNIAYSVTSLSRVNRQTIEGARYFITYPRETFVRGKLEASGSVELSGCTCIDWFLWDGERPDVHSYAAKSGYIAALYPNELYDVKVSNFVYRNFGVSEAKVRQNLWLIIRPVELDEVAGVGVYPRTDRNALLLRGGPDAGNPLPLAEWGSEFAEKMPSELIAAIANARGAGVQEVGDEQWRERLAERFGSRWRIPKLRAKESGSLSFDPTQPGATPRRRLVAAASDSSSGTRGGRGGASQVGSRPGAIPAERSSVAGGLPSFRRVTSQDVGDDVLASWQPHDPEHPEGVVLINVQHPVLRAQIEHYQMQFAEAHADAIRDEVIRAYGEAAVAKIAHSEQLRGLVNSDIIDNEMRSDAALTMALLGLVAEEAYLSPKLGGRFGRRRIAS
jgi:hypothetical protein